MILSVLVSFMFLLFIHVHFIHFLHWLFTYFNFNFLSHIFCRLFHHFLALFLLQRFLCLFSWQITFSFMFFDISFKWLSRLSFNFFFDAMILWHLHLRLSFCPIIFFLVNHLLYYRLFVNPRFISSNFMFYMSLNLNGIWEMGAKFELIFIFKSLDLEWHVIELLFKAMYFVKERLHSRVNFLLN